MIKSKNQCPYFDFLLCEPKQRKCNKCSWYNNPPKKLSSNISDCTQEALEKMGRKSHGQEE